MVEPVEQLGETAVVSDEAAPEAAGGMLATEVVGNGGVTQAEDLLLTALLQTALLLTASLVTAALVFSSLELATEELEATALEVVETTTGVEVGASSAGAVAAQLHKAEADD